MNRTAETAAPPRLKGLMFDLDGTLLLSDRSLGGYEILPGAAELLTELERRAFPFVVLTNGSAALLLGSPGVGQALRDARIETVRVGDRGERDVQAVYVGWYPECTMKAIEAACHAIWAGARLYVASDVPFFATKEGRTMGYSYAIAGAIRRVTRAPMILTGKPSLHALRFVARRLGLRRRDLGIVGDDPSVEIIMARRGGAKAFAVTTGVTACEEWERQTGLRRPEQVLRRLGDLLESVAPLPSEIRDGVMR